MMLSMAELTDQFLTLFVSYGPPMLCLALFIGALGVPLPGTFFVIAAGAFMRQGVLDVTLTPMFALIGAFLGDVSSYGIGRFARGFIQKRFGQSPTWQRAEETLQQRGGGAVYLTRWLITPLAIPVNLVTGSSGYPLSKFIIFDVAGEITWLLIYGGLGYSFGSQWEVISDFVNDFSGLIVGVVILVAGLYLLLRRRPERV